MPFQVVGYFPERTAEGYAAVKVPVFKKDGSFFIQKIDEDTSHIIDFVLVGQIDYRDLPSGEVMEKDWGDEALYIFIYGGEYLAGGKGEIDKEILWYIQRKKLPNRNLYSLYIFLGLPKMVERVVEEIIRNNEMGLTKRLKKENFVIPQVVDIGGEKLEKDKVVRILRNYLNIVKECSDIQYSDMISTSPDEEGLVVSEPYMELGVYRFRRRELEFMRELVQETKNSHLTERLAISDFSLNALWMSGNELPGKGKFFKEISDEVMVAPFSKHRKQFVAKCEFQIRSSTSFYDWDTTAPLGHETFVMINQRVEKELEEKDDLPLPAHEAEEKKKETVDMGRFILQHHSLK